MAGFANTALDAALSENLALVYLLGMCTFIAVSRRVGMAVGLGLAVLAVLMITAPLNHFLYHRLLAPGALSWAGRPDLDLSFLRFIAFIGVIAATVQILDLFLDRFVPRLHHAMGIYLPLLTVNCAILGTSLLMVQRQLDFAGSVAYAAGAGAGWAAAVVVFAALRERIRYSDAPVGLHGLGLSFVVTGLLALGFGGLSGIEFTP